MSMLRILALVALLLSACAGSEPLDAAEETAPLVVAIETAPEAPVCSVTFTPAPELDAETREAASRWSAATGCDIRVGEGGIPLRLVEERMVTPSGGEGHGHTYCPTEGCTRSGLVIDVARDHVAATVPHEMGHALGASSGHVEGETALMCPTGGDGAIVSADLVYVCEALDCTRFVPEA